MRLIVFMIIIFGVISCNQGRNGYVCKSVDGSKYAIVIDSTFHFMCGFDSMYSYDLKYLYQIKLEEDEYRVYSYGYASSVGLYQGSPIDCPLKFKVSKDLGSLPIMIETGEYVIFGGYDFEIVKNDSAKLIFDFWSKLILENRDAKIMEWAQE